LKLRMDISPDHERQYKDAYIFAFEEDQILVIKAGTNCRIPRSSDLIRIQLTVIRELYLGVLHNRPCYAIDLGRSNVALDDYYFIGLRELFTHVPEDLFTAAGYAFQILHWDRMHQYCGKCGSFTNYASAERAKVCCECEEIYYPRISPAIIVAVKKGHKLLLARNKKRKTGFYSVLAGFVEPGETLEDCVKREVKEETAIDVKNIKYFGSQPWPFPNTLMIAFTADYAGGEIKEDGQEIVDAHETLSGRCGFTGNRRCGCCCCTL